MQISVGSVKGAIQQSELGTPAIESVTTPVNAVNYFTGQTQTPAGKARKLVAVNARGGTGTFTISDITIKVYDGVGAINIKTVTGVSAEYVLDAPIIIPAGWYVQVVYNVTAKAVDGNVVSTFLYGEYTAA